jgi:AcrR family transcriptional regulator
MKKPPEKKGKRPRVPGASATRTRDAVATRRAILESAKRAFARAGYEGAGVREIAAGAGVTAMLINRYFGSKEQLFAEVVVEIMANPVVLAPKSIASSRPSEPMAAALVEITRPGVTPLEGFLIMLRSAGSERAAEIGREQIEAHYQKTLSSALRGEDAAVRAGVILSLVAGLQMMRQALGLPSLVKAKPAALARVIERVLRALIEPA